MSWRTSRLNLDADFKLVLFNENDVDQDVFYIPDPSGLAQLVAGDEDVRAALRDSHHLKIYERQRHLIRSNKWTLIARFNSKMFLEEN